MTIRVTDFTAGTTFYAKTSKCNHRLFSLFFYFGNCSVIDVAVNYKYSNTESNCHGNDNS